MTMQPPSVTERPGWTQYFMGIAQAVARRADCSKHQYGAVIVKDNRIVATGYNGTPPGDRRSCLNGDCPRASVPSQHERATRTSIVESPTWDPESWKNPHHVDYTNCIALHAEQNAIAYASHHDTVGATIYLWGDRPARPCDMCEKLIAAAGIIATVYAGSMD